MSEVKKKNVTGSSPSDPHAIKKESNFLCCTLYKYPPIHLNEVSSSPLKGRLVFLFYHQYFKDIDNFLFAFQLVIFWESKPSPCQHLFHTCKWICDYIPAKKEQYQWNKTTCSLQYHEEKNTKDQIFWG